MSVKPSVFVGSSSEGLRIAGYVQYCLADVARPKLWNQGVFGLGSGFLETLVSEVKKHDFAILVMSPDDRTVSRDVETSSPRDNVVFELGLFMGYLGRDRTFVLYDDSAGMKLLSDLSGISNAAYDGDWARDDLASAIGVACHPIREVILRLGRLAPNTEESSPNLTKFEDPATKNVEIAIQPNLPIVTTLDSRNVDYDGDCQDDWSIDELALFSVGLKNAVVALRILDSAAASPNTGVSFSDACTSLGMTAEHGKRHVASMTQVMNRLRKKCWPVKWSNDPTGVQYTMSTLTAEKWISIRNRPNEPNKGSSSPKMGQRAVMKQLAEMHNYDKSVVIAKYAQAERTGKAQRLSDEHSTAPEEYARRLWEDGIKKGWL